MSKYHRRNISRTKGSLTFNVYDNKNNSELKKNLKNSKIYILNQQEKKLDQI